MPRNRKTADDVMGDIYADLFPVPQNEQAALESPGEWIAREKIERNPDQPRRHFDPVELRDLAGSLREHGQLQSLLVRPHPDEEKRAQGIVQLLAGERRWRAGEAFPAQGDLAGLAPFPRYFCIVREADDETMLVRALEENKQRRDISSFEEARALLRLQNMVPGAREGQPAAIRHIEARVKMQKSRIQQLTALLTLPGYILDEADALRLNEKHGRALLMLQAHPDEQRQLLREIERGELSGNQAVKRAETLLEQLAGGDDSDENEQSENDKQLGSRAHEKSSQKAGKGGVGSSAPASKGSGFATSSDNGQSDKAAPGQSLKTVSSNPLDAQIAPAAAFLKEAERKLNAAAPLHITDEKRLENELKTLRNVITQLENVLEFSRKLNRGDKE